MSENRNFWYRAEYHSMAIIISAAIAVFMFLGRGALSEDYFIAYWLSAFIVFFLMILVFSLRVEVDDHSLYLTYGIGIITTELPLYTIAEAGPVKNDSIFSIPYHLRASHAVRITMRDGKKYTLPAEQPKQFAQELLRRAYQQQ